MPDPNSTNAWPTIIAAGIGVIGGLGGASIKEIWTDLRDAANDKKSKNAVTHALRVVLRRCEEGIDEAQTGVARLEEHQSWSARLVELAFCERTARLLHIDDLRAIMVAAGEYDAFVSQLNQAPDALDPEGRALFITESSSKAYDAVKTARRAIGN